MTAPISSAKLWERARNILPGGVNSPVRAFGSVGAEPVFIASAAGALLKDRDGKEYVDCICSWGPMILGHAHPAVTEALQNALLQGTSFGAATEEEVLFAEELQQAMPSLEMMRMVSSGTEATLSAVRAARGFTGREKIVKFRGCYHGHGDQFLIEAGSGAVTHGVPSSAGVTRGAATDTLLADYNDLDSVNRLFNENKGEIACIILEAVAGNMGVVLPEEGFLQGLRTLATTHGSLLIFDEVMTGFRAGAQGAQGHFQVEADLTTLGKVVGGGLPVGVYGGRREVMEKISPLGPVYQAGTLSGNPLAVAAGRAQLRVLREDPGIFARLEENCSSLAGELLGIFREAGVPVSENHVGSMFTLFFTDGVVRNFDTALACDTELFGAFFRGMLERGVFLAPSQFEALFLSTAHDAAIVDRILQAARDTSSTL